MDNFTPLEATLGGLLIGLSASLLFLWLGKVAGISGILGDLLKSSSISIENSWKITFLIGLIVSPLIWFSVTKNPFPVVDASLPALIIGGLLVGFGTRLGRGCTSGHGVCGIARFSKRSLTATIVFMVVAIITVGIIRHVVGG